MSNPLRTIGHGLKVAAEDVIKAVEYPVEFLVKAEKVIASAIHDQPEIKAAILSLVKQAQTVIADTVGAVAGKGLDLAADAKALADAEAFFEYFKSTFIPLVEKVYTEVAADLN
ncbi:MAG: hypothetical protein JWQ49_102 [Edaphobacter sp.]|nr:hypothetical protein [Edaphobacter sp.]